MMNYKPILIVAGEPNSIFNEILIKSLKKKKIKSPIILIVSIKVFKLQMKKLKLNYPYQIFKNEDINGKKIDNKKLNIIDVDYNTKNAFEKISSRSNRYIEECFKIALKLIKLGYTDKFINGPISKKHFLKNKFFGNYRILSKKN